MSKKLSIWTGVPATIGQVNLSDVNVLIHILISVVVLVFSYNFNKYYINKHHQVLAAAEVGAHTPKTMITFKSLILGLIILIPTMPTILIYQSIYSTEFPLGLFFPSFFLTITNMYFAKKQKVREYFAHRVKQMKWQMSTCPVTRHRSRVSPAPDIEMKSTL